VSAFCERLGYGEVYAAIKTFTKRVWKTRKAIAAADTAADEVAAERGGAGSGGGHSSGGCERGSGQVVTLTAIKGLAGPRARLLAEQGIDTPAKLAVLEVDW
jgi:predicted flap endonuclease-1-like 5' DNA nuclease